MGELRAGISRVAIAVAFAAPLALIALFSVFVLVYGGLRLVQMTLELGQTTAALGWPMAAHYGGVPAVLDRGTLVVDMSSDDGA